MFLKILSALGVVRDILKLIVRLVAQWKGRRLEKSVDDSLEDHDQRDFEEQIGSDNAGKETKIKKLVTKKRKAKVRK